MPCLSVYNIKLNKKEVDMTSLFTEDTYERAIVELFEHMGYMHIYAPDMDRDYTSPLLESVLRDSLIRVNKGLVIEAIDEAIIKLKNIESMVSYS